MRTMTEFAETSKLTCLKKKKTMTTFVSNWKPFIDFLLKIGKKINFYFMGFIIRNNRMWKEWNHNIILERKYKI